MQVILASHSRMAKGLKKTTELIMGKQPNLKALEAYDDDQIPLKDQVTALIAKNASNEKYLFLTDIVGGSVNTEIVQMIRDKENMFLVAGMNLPLVLSALTTEMNNCSSNQIKNKLEELCDEARQGLQVVQLASQEADDF